MIDNSEHVARVIFEPKMVYEGRLLDAAFVLRPQISESYYSVLRLSIDSWKEDIVRIPTHKNRRLWGYADMPVKDIREIDLEYVTFDVVAVDNASMPSHAGIIVTVNGKCLIGGEKPNNLPGNVTADFVLLAIRTQLIELAQRRLCQWNQYGEYV